MKLGRLSRRQMGEKTALLPPPTLAGDDLPGELVVVPEYTAEPELEPAGEPETEPPRPPSLAEMPGPTEAPELTFEAFFEAHYARLLRAMYLVCGNSHEAEEVTQDAFVRALERWDRVRRAGNPPGYLYRIAVNLYRSKLRRVARAARKVVQPPPEPDPFAAADDRDAIGRALAALPPGQREAMVMVEWMGMTDDEVGPLLGVSPITIRVRIHRAKATLRPILERGEDE